MFSKSVLDIDAAKVADTICSALRTQVADLRRRGIVVGLSGGIDSSVVTTLSVRALGAERVQVLLMPERDSSPESRTLGTMLANQLGVRVAVEDIAPTLEAAGCYSRQIEAIRSVFPQYGEGYRNKIILPSLLTSDPLNQL
jgi:NAD+ synthase